MPASLSLPKVPALHPFVHRMILRNAINAALQRARVYTDAADFISRRRFRERAKDWLLDFGERYDRASTTETTWCANIEALASTLSAESSTLLRYGRVTFGVAQKMVSLYLKYRWLLGDPCKKPLFAVVDRGIMKEAGITPLSNWTAHSRTDYLRVARSLDAFATTQLDLNGQSYADGASWEADFWSDEPPAEES